MNWLHRHPRMRDAVLIAFAVLYAALLVTLLWQLHDNPVIAR